MWNFSPLVSKWKLNMAPKQEANSCRLKLQPPPSVFIQSVMTYLQMPIPLWLARSWHWGPITSLPSRGKCSNGRNGVTEYYTVTGAPNRNKAGWQKSEGVGAILNRRQGHLSRDLSNHTSIWETATTNGEQVQRPWGRNEPDIFEHSEKASVAKAEWMRPDVLWEKVGRADRDQTNGH